MANFKCSSFASSAVNNLILQKNRTMVQLTGSITYWGQILPRDAMLYSSECWNLSCALCM